MSKKYNVVDYNEEEKEIIIERKKSKFKEFREKYNKNILLALFLLVIIFGVLAIYFTISNLSDSSEPLYEDLNIDFNDEEDVVVNDNTSDESSDNTNSSNTVITKDNAEKILEIVKNNNLKSKGEALMNNHISKNNIDIWYLSDGTTLMKKNGIIYRVSSRSDGSYGVSEKGEIYNDVYSKIVTITNTKQLDYGTVEYYSDGSAMIYSDKDSIFVRDSKDIEEKYIVKSKISYIKETKKIGSYEVIYYTNGIINITGQGKDYVVHKEEDFNIDGSNITFNYSNEATLIEEVNYNDNRTKIRYYNDGTAIIFKNNNYISLRKDNAINTSGSTFIDIEDEVYVKPLKTKNISNGKIYYYNNGSAIISYNNGDDLYIPNNEDIRYENDNLKEIDGDAIKRTDVKEVDGNIIKYFDDNIYVVSKDEKELIGDNSSINTYGAESKTIDKKSGKYTINNDTKKTINYRLVIEKSDNTTIDESFVNYSIDVDDDIKSGTITDNIWNVGSKLSGNKTIGKTTYILYEGKLNPLTSTSVNLLLYYDYTNMDNSMQDKWFKGTFKVYGWEED